MTETVTGNSRRVRILGVPVDTMSMETAIRFIKDHIESGKPPGYIVAINPEKIIAIRKDEFLRRFVESATLLIPDGIGVVLSGMFLTGKRFSRVTGVDLMERLCRMAAGNHFRVFLYGAREDVNEMAAEALVRKYPGLTIAGRSHGYVPPESENELIQRINRTEPDILFVALGSPRQERWIRQHLADLNVRICQGIGGTLDAVTGRVRRAPGWIQRIGLEWLYRLVKQPTRIMRQMNLIAFAWWVLMEKLTGKSVRSGTGCGDE